MQDKIIPIRIKDGGVLLFGLYPERDGSYCFPLLVGDISLKADSCLLGNGKRVFNLRSNYILCLEEEIHFEMLNICWVTLQEVPFMIGKKEIQVIPRVVQALIQKTFSLRETRAN